MCLAEGDAAGRGAFTADRRVAAAASFTTFIEEHVGSNVDCLPVFPFSAFPVRTLHASELN
jgi:hypothetical protein